MTGFAACSRCGAIQRKRPALDTNEFRNRPRESDAAGARRRNGFVIALAVAVLVGGITYCAIPFFRLVETASQSLIESPVTLADDLRNREIHAARRFLHVE